MKKPRIEGRRLFAEPDPRGAPADVALEARRVLLFMAFVALAGRAFWIQGPGNAFFKKQGESRYQRTLELPATRGQILDRNGLVLATSLPVRAIWAIPEAVPTTPAPTSCAARKLLDMPQKELRAKLSDGQDLRLREAPGADGSRAQVAALDIPGIYSRDEYKRFYPEGEITAHLIGFTNIEDKGQEGVELGDQKRAGRHAGHAPRDQGPHGPHRRGRRRAGRAASTARTSSCRSTARFSTSRTSSSATRSIENFKAKAGACVVHRRADGRGAGAGQLPDATTRTTARHLTGEQLRNRIADRHLRAGLDHEAVHCRMALDDGPRHAEYAWSTPARPLRARRLRDHATPHAHGC